MKFDQDLRLNLRYDFGKMNSTLGSVVPLAMFVHLSTPASIGWVAQSFLVRSYRQGDISFFFFDSFSSAFSFSPPQPAPPSPPHFPFLLSYFSYYSVWDEDSCSLVSFYLSSLILLNVKLKTINGLEYIYKSKSESFHYSKHKVYREPLKYCLADFFLQRGTHPLSGQFFCGIGGGPPPPHP